VPWNLATLAGSWAGQGIPDPASLGVDFVFPLAFLALLVPLLEGWPEVVVAGVAGLLALGLSRVAPGGLAVLVAGVVGSLLGAVLTAGRPEPAAPTPEAPGEVRP